MMPGGRLGGKEACPGASGTGKRNLVMGVFAIPADELCLTGCLSFLQY